MDRKCMRCGVDLEAGSLVAAVGGAMPAGAVSPQVSQFEFVRPGTPTSWNPIKAFRQGLANEPGDASFPVHAWRCPQCGLLELSAARE